MIRLKLYFAWFINRYVTWSCNLNAKLIRVQGNILEEVKTALNPQLEGANENV